MPFLHHIDPVLLHLGPLEIRYYSLVYIFGFLLVFFLLDHYRKAGEIKITKNQLYDFLFYLILGLLLGSRLFMYLWHPTYYFQNPLEIFKIWHGGMSFHGGLTGVLIASYLFCKKHRLNLALFADLLTLPAVFILALGRIANFINAELYGPITNLPWCTYFPNTEGCRHPTQLYGALKRFVIFGILIFLNRKSHKPGFLFWTFLTLMGLGRFFIDFYRLDPTFLSLTLGQYFSLAMLVLGSFVLIKYYKKDIKNLFP